MQTSGIHQAIESREKRVRVTIGGDRLEHEGNMSTIPTTLIIAKIHLNSTMFTKESRHTTQDIKDCYYGMPTQKCEFGRLTVKLIPQEIMEHYNLDKLASKDKVCFEIQKGIPGLK